MASGCSPSERVTPHRWPEKAAIPRSSSSTWAAKSSLRRSPPCSTTEPNPCSHAHRAACSTSGGSMVYRVTAVLLRRIPQYRQSQAQTLEISTSPRRYATRPTVAAFTA